MKKQLLLAVSLLAVFIGAKGQKPDTAWLMVHYKFTQVRDTTNREHPYTENMVLFVGKSASNYRSYDGLIADRQFKKAYAEAVASSPDGQPNINRKGVGTNIQYFQYPGERKLFTRELSLLDQYSVEDTLPVIAWKIRGDTATFGGLHCQKATCHFKGRDYVAWFCPDLPVHSGPWKLNGLPGVIVDAHDTRNDVIFAFDGVERTVSSPAPDPATANTDEKKVDFITRGLDDDPNMIKPPAWLQKTTRQAFDKAREAFRKNPEAAAQAANAANMQDGGNRPILKMNHGTPPINNNPIELPEQQ
ncbi:MAG TPA: GLPGLI family protein [Puia sp.]|jgi:GLPGLI family protein